MISTCEITMAGIGGPLIDFDGNFVGMNFYAKKRTPFLPRNKILECLVHFETLWRKQSVVYSFGTILLDLLSGKHAYSTKPCKLSSCLLMRYMRYWRMMDITRMFLHFSMFHIPLHFGLKQEFRSHPPDGRFLRLLFHDHVWSKFKLRNGLGHDHVWSWIFNRSHFPGLLTFWMAEISLDHSKSNATLNCRLRWSNIVLHKRHKILPVLLF